MIFMMSRESCQIIFRVFIRFPLSRSKMIIGSRKALRSMKNTNDKTVAMVTRKPLTDVMSLPILPKISPNGLAAWAVSIKRMLISAIPPHRSSNFCFADIPIIIAEFGGEGEGEKGLNTDFKCHPEGPGP